MIFKDTTKKDEFWVIHPLLREILCVAENFLKKRGQITTITCLMRNEDEQRVLFAEGKTEYKTSVHMFGRGGDLRLTEHNSDDSDLINYLNQKYVYDLLRPGLHTAMIHGGSASHIHIQVLE